MQLSPHFKLVEFTRSATAQARHIDNTPNEEQIKNLKFLCDNGATDKPCEGGLSTLTQKPLLNDT